MLDCDFVVEGIEWGYLWKWMGWCGRVIWLGLEKVGGEVGGGGEMEVWG